MPGPYPLPTLACTIDSAGISAPSFQDVLLSLQAIYRNIYGSQIDLDPDTQDGQFLAALATIINDTNNSTIATYNAYSPSTALGNGLSSVVKINAIRRKDSSASTAIVTIVGPVGTVIDNGRVGDNLGLNTQWSVPNLVIPILGTIDVLATCLTEGDIRVDAHALTVILTPTLGWQSVDNAAPALPGEPVEDDATLRQRQSISTGKPAQTPLESIIANVANVAGVGRSIIYENDGPAPDSNGIPSHSVSVVVEGGLFQSIIDAIGSTKSPGTGTFGDQHGTYVDPAGVDQPVNFFYLSSDRIIVHLTVHALAGWSNTTVDTIKASIAAYINSLTIGEFVFLFRVAAAAALYNDQLGSTFNITALTQSIFPAVPAAADIAIAFNHAAHCDVADITVTVA